MNLLRSAQTGTPAPHIRSPPKLNAPPVPQHARSFDPSSNPNVVPRVIFKDFLIFKLIAFEGKTQRSRRGFWSSLGPGVVVGVGDGDIRV